MKRWTPVAVLGAALVLGLLFAATRDLPSSRADGDKPEYVGVKKCKSCHFKEHKSYLKTIFVDSYNHLKPDASAEAKKKAGLDPAKDFSQDPKCLKCHTTGYGTPSGFPEVAEGKTWSDAEKKRAELHGAVTCEACHGPMSLAIPYKKEHKDYKRADIQKLGALVPVTAKNCEHCHAKECPTMPDDYKFDFETFRKSDKLHAHKKLKHEH